MLLPVEIARAASAMGAKKAEMPHARMFSLAVLAGAYIAFGGNFATVVSSDLSKYFGYGFAQLVTGAVFALGLTLVVLGGAELFTGNNMVLTVAALDGAVSWPAVARAWAIVYAGNFVGALLMSSLAYASGQWAAANFQVGARALAIANAKVGLTLSQAFFRGVLCNWLVCLAVWLTLAAKDVAGKVSALFFPIAAFVACGFEHSIANMYFVPLGIFLGRVEPVVAAAGLSGKIAGLGWWTFVTRNLLPVTAGNIVGGAVFVGLAYWYAYLGRAPVAPGASGSTRSPGST
ncbi:MAG: formate/nitrite transporter family protein [Firmicutes bacterium]|jgi:formate/nitrite transporter|nr:formate/nitrite transporter family protein [Bacillota bacterium]